MGYSYFGYIFQVYNNFHNKFLYLSISFYNIYSLAYFQYFFDSTYHFILNVL